MAADGEKYYDRIKNFVRRRVTSTQEAEDIVQEVFYQYSRLDDILNPVANVTAWLYRVARNRIIDSSRKKREESLPQWAEGDRQAVMGEMAEALTDISSPEAAMMGSMLWERLDEALDELPEAQREVFEMTEIKGLSIKEIQEITGVPQATLLSRKHYAVLYLRKKLADLYDDLMDY